MKDLGGYSDFSLQQNETVLRTLSSLFKFLSVSFFHESDEAFPLSFFFSLDLSNSLSNCELIAARYVNFESWEAVMSWYDTIFGTADLKYLCCSR